jgi:adenine-specific DNA-methyltransferase
MPTLHLVGKEKVVNHHLDVPFRVLNKESSFRAPEGSPPNRHQSWRKPLVKIPSAPPGGQYWIGVNSSGENSAALKKYVQFFSYV